MPVATGVRETPGAGLSLATHGGEVRLGSRAWCGVGETAVAEGPPGPELWLARPRGEARRLAFTDPLRPDAREVIDALEARGLAVEVLSGDREESVATVTESLGIERWRAGLSPVEKCRRLDELAAAGHRVMMVGDGINDAPSLAAALVSMSPASAAEVSQAAADVVFQGTRLAPVAEALDVASRSDRLVRQNVALSFLYNAVTVPLAVLGHVTPLVAAIAMSASSLLVVANALRLSRDGAT